MVKVTLLHGYFSRFLNCTNGTKPCNTSHGTKHSKIDQVKFFEIFFSFFPEIFFGLFLNNLSHIIFDSLQSSTKNWNHFLYEIGAGKEMDRVNVTGLFL